MKKRKLIFSVLALSLSACMLTGCLDDEYDDDYAYSDDSYSDDVSADGESYGSGGQVSESTQYGTGLEEIKVEGFADPDPDKKVVRSRAPIRQLRGIDMNGNALSDDFYFYRNMLNSTGKQAYDQIYAALYRGVSTLDMNVAISADDIETIVFSVYYDHPELFWVDCYYYYYTNSDDIVTTVTVNFNGTADNITQAQSDFERCVANLLLKAQTFSTDIEKVKYVHDYLTNINDYVAGSQYNQSAYSALVYGKTVCAGYAHAFQYCMQKLGIPAAYVVGHAGESHAWNLVKLDGEYYAMDVTWDDPIGNPATTYYYNYFNITDAELSRDHTRYDISAGLPTANGTKYSYANWYGSGNYGSDFRDFGTIDGQIPTEYGNDTFEQDSSDDSSYDNDYDTNYDSSDDTSYDNSYDNSSDLDYDDYYDSDDDSIFSWFDSLFSSDYDWGYGNDYYDEDESDYTDYDDDTCCYYCWGIFCDGECCDDCCMYR